MNIKLVCALSLFVTVISFLFFVNPTFAEIIISQPSFSVGNVHLSVDPHQVLTKTDALTGKWLGEQRFSVFTSILYVPKSDVLLVSGKLEGGNSYVLVKIRGTGGTGRNMFALNPDGSSVPRYSYRLGSQSFGVEFMRYDDRLNTLEVTTLSSGFDWNVIRGTTYIVKGTGGTGNNMFAIDSSRQCANASGYHYLLSCNGRVAE